MSRAGCPGDQHAQYVRGISTHRMSGGHASMVIGCDPRKNAKVRPACQLPEGANPIRSRAARSQSGPGISRRLMRPALHPPSPDAVERGLRRQPPSASPCLGGQRAVDELPGAAVADVQMMPDLGIFCAAAAHVQRNLGPFRNHWAHSTKARPSLAAYTRWPSQDRLGRKLLWNFIGLRSPGCFNRSTAPALQRPSNGASPPSTGFRRHLTHPC
jgi:hypothetical protein